MPSTKTANIKKKLLLKLKYGDQMHNRDKKKVASGPLIVMEFIAELTQDNCGSGSEQTQPNKQY